MTGGDLRSDEGVSPIRAWLEADLETQPIEGTLSPPHGSPSPFVGWLGLTAAIEGLSPGRDSPDGSSAGPD